MKSGALLIDYLLRVILACIPGEQHELGLLAFGVALRRRGWRITYLGTDSPIGPIADIARSVVPAVVVLLGMTEEGFLDQAGEIEQLANQVQVVIAAGAQPTRSPGGRGRMHWIRTQCALPRPSTVTMRPRGMAGGEAEVTARAELQRHRHRTDKITATPSSAPAS